MGKLESYNGHRSWNAWNVALWISNDEDLYYWAMQCLRDCKTLDKATCKFVNFIGGPKAKTPNGATYNHLSVKLALAGLSD
jgi:hypothetical protein